MFEDESFEPVAERREAAEWIHFKNDPAGAPDSLISEFGHSLEASQPKSWSGAGETTTTRIRFQGQQSDRETGLSYNRYRYYDPDAKCFASTDPAKLFGGCNSYRFVRNPFGWIDPLGLVDEALNAAPTTPGVYHAVGPKGVYTGSGENLRERLTDPNHDARALLDDPATSVTVWEADISSADKDQTRTCTRRAANAQALRAVEQDKMDEKKNVPKVGPSQNKRRAAAKTRHKKFHDAHKPKLSKKGKK
ncbi:MAG: RHS repeat-associated core domain-containing protein [Myxococcales bacterium]|nr:RHS repeat-associated core domain-containing protein [Myxococcales bacterium]